ncbi:hypothetical protein DXZ20_25730 [Leptolyngbyaceae cyanobacterium CCMR0081]|uniref:Uncharacterized protein n=1 Tax=Adonisia turfae CCMR0081 TaxID=2292702 RepID=A0A6M0RS88_9CYAN|nr:hypothetical protein [Adonisia turfae CCMR0081]
MGLVNNVPWLSLATTVNWPWWRKEDSKTGVEVDVVDPFTSSTKSVNPNIWLTATQFSTESDVSTIFSKIEINKSWHHGA